MASSRADYLQKRLTSEGLGTEAIQGYIQVLRQFLTAKMTKMAFEEAISKVLPKEKYSVHNSIILELLHRAQMKREGHPDVPVIQPVKEKKSSANKNNGSQRRRNNNADGNVGKRRKTDKEVNGSLGPGIAPGTRTGNNQRGANPTNKPCPKLPKIDPHTHVEMPAGGPVRNQLGIPPSEIPTYDTLSFQPVRPGQAIDVELFLRIRARMAAQVEKYGISGGVKDEAVALATHALEQQVKRIMENCVRNRQHREGTLAGRFKHTLPVAAHDLREGMLRDVQQLGNDPSEALERLSLLL